MKVIEEETKKDEVEETKNGADEKSSDESSEKGKKVPPKKRATKAKEPKKEVKKEANKRKEKKKENEDDGDDEEEVEDSMDAGAQDATDSNKVPLLDQPLELEGTRERKKVQRFTEDFKAESQSFVPIDIPQGKGDCLGDIPCINAYLQSYKVESLKPLHRLLFGRLGKVHLIKENIKQFNGFEYAKGSEAYEKKRIVISKLDVRTLKTICSFLDLEKKGNRDELATRIAEYLVCPKDSGRPAPVSRPKRSSAQKANKRGFSESEDEHEHHPKSRRSRGKHVSTKESSSESEEKNTKMASSRRRRKMDSVTEGKESDQEEPEAETGPEGDDQDDVEQDGHSDTEESDEPKSKKKGKSNANVNANAKKSPIKKSSSKKAPNKKAEKKQSGKKRKEKDDNSEGNESSEDEPLSKKSKNPPTDEEIKSYVKEILEGANLEEITMKTVCKQVYGHYPDFDLSHKKDFIKTTVKSLISP